MSIVDLKTLRRELRKIEAGVQIKTYSDFKHMSYVYKGKAIEGNVFAPHQLAMLEPLISFINSHKEAIIQVAKDEGLTGAKKFMQGY
jgi:hypothetical protein